MCKNGIYRWTNMLLLSYQNQNKKSAKFRFGKKGYMQISG